MSFQLNLGCGQIRPVGWINTDSSLNALLQRSTILKTLASPFLKTKYSSSNCRFMNVTRKWPFSDGTVTVVYASHLFEHIRQSAADFFVKEAFRVLKPGGIIRLVVPSLYLHSKKYVERIQAGEMYPADEFMWALNLHREGQYGRARGVHGWLGTFQDWPHQHKYMYDQQTLSRQLTKAGFVDIHESAYGASNYIKNIIEVEAPDKTGYENSLYLEATKSIK